MRDSVKQKIETGKGTNRGKKLYELSTNQNNNDKIREMLVLGAPVNWRHPTGGWTALMEAAKDGNMELIVMLLMHGETRDLRGPDKGKCVKCDFRARNSYGQTALDWAWMGGTKDHKKVAMLLQAWPRMSKEQRLLAAEMLNEP